MVGSRHPASQVPPVIHHTIIGMQAVMDLLLITGTTLLPEPGRDMLIEHGFVAVRGNTIFRTGPMEEIGGLAMAATRVVDGRGLLTMPGLVNGHCHAAMTLFRGLADDLDLATWLNRYIFPAEARHVHPEMVYHCSLLAAAEMLLSGTTCVADAYFHESEAARAFARAGLRAIVAQGIIDFPAPGVPDPADNVRVAADFLEQWTDRSPRISPALFAHAPYTCSPATLNGARDLAHRFGVPLFIHVAETRGEAAMIADPLGDSPVRHLDAAGILDGRTVCIHCVWLDERDLDILAKRDTAVITCPQSNLKLASGIADIPAMRRHGIRVGLGTDGAASNNGLDMFREMDLCAKVQKLHDLDPVAVPARQVLAMATDSHPLPGLPRGLGRLAPGCPADLVLVDLDQPRLQPFHGPDLLVYAASGGDVHTVLIDGQLVVEDRKLLTIDLEETMARVRELARQVACR